jgi:hypothetical protein
MILRVQEFLHRDRWKAKKGSRSAELTQTMFLMENQVKFQRITAKKIPRKLT